MSLRAGIVVTGTEVLTRPRQRPQRPVARGAAVASSASTSRYTTIVGDRPEDMLAALRFMAAPRRRPRPHERRPRADRRRPHRRGRRRLPGARDGARRAAEERIAEIVRPLARRWPHLDKEAIAAANRKQATVPAGATVLEPVGTAPGLVVPPRGWRGADDRRAARARRASCGRCGRQALATEALREALAGATDYEQRMLRLFGIPESEIAETLRVAEREGVDLGAMEVTTCLRRGEVEIVTRYEPHAAGGLRGLRGGRPRAPRRHALLRRRQHRRRAGRRAAARRRHAPDALARDRRVLHRRAAGGAPDRPGRAPRTTSSAASSPTPTRPRTRSRACRAS